MPVARKPRNRMLEAVQQGASSLGTLGELASKGLGLAFGGDDPAEAALDLAPGMGMARLFPNDAMVAKVMQGLRQAGFKGKLRPALKFRGKVTAGNVGEDHFTVQARLEDAMGLPANELSGRAGRGFVDETGQYISREDLGLDSHSVGHFFKK